MMEGKGSIIVDRTSRNSASRPGKRMRPKPKPTTALENTEPTMAMPDTKVEFSSQRVNGRMVQPSA